MGSRAGRRRPTRAEKIRRSERGKVSPPQGRRVKRSEDQSATKPADKKRRKISQETQELVAEYARVMGCSPERVLPHYEVSA